MASKIARIGYHPDEGRQGPPAHACESPNGDLIMAIVSVNPATGATIRAYNEMSPAEAAAAVEAAHRGWTSWRDRSFAERGRVLRRTAELLRSRKDELAELMAEEMGKPVRQGVSEAEKCAWVCEYYADNAEAQLAPDIVPTEATSTYVAFEPLGVVLAVMPWNFPLWQVYRFAAPALMAGNAAVLKHASNVPGCALVIEEIFRQAGLPDGTFRTLLIGNQQVKAVIEHPLVRAVTLTGSTPAGRAVAAQAGAVLKKTVLELGGSDPYLILDDADLALTVETCVNARLINSGQSCIAAKRFIVVESVLDAFTDRFVAAMKMRKMGDPRSPDTDVGPQARGDLRDGLHKQVTESVARGAKLLLGGEVPNGGGAFYPPSVLAEVRPGMPAFDEELFGPVAAIIRAEDEDDAVRLANQSVFGLGAAVFTRDLKRGEAVARRLDAGAVFVNAQVASDPRLPFGGIKESGYGRELGSYGIKEFVNIKTVHVR